MAVDLGLVIPSNVPLTIKRHVRLTLVQIQSELCASGMSLQPHRGWVVLENNRVSVPPLTPTHTTGQAGEFPEDTTEPPYKTTSRNSQPEAKLKMPVGMKGRPSN